ncbi:hypothetical protein [Streptomyces sp. NPDC002328]|uniref:hypothetical protein n=1 Tax=Streptomyces sp. NPDC002328 TaxID=3364642 RepID=UPI0036909607
MTENPYAPTETPHATPPTPATRTPEPEADTTPQPQTETTNTPAPADGSVPADWTVPTAPVPPASPSDSASRRLRRPAALRWIAAGAVFAVVGTVSAYGVARLDRSAMPGLAAEAGGLWEFPRLTRPPLPSGSPAPFAADADPDDPGVHHADLRALVLPAPKGATQDATLRGSDGWLTKDDFLAAYEERDRAALGQRLVDTGLRHIAARGWTTPDGTRTRVYLLHFATSAVVDDLFHQHLAPAAGPAHQVRGAERAVPDEDLPDASAVADIRRSVYDEPRPYGTEHVRQGYLSAGDVLAVVLQSREGTVDTVPFAQTLALQSQLLG